MTTSTSYVLVIPNWRIGTDGSYRVGQTDGYEGRRTTGLSTSESIKPPTMATTMLTPACRFVQLVRKYHPNALLHFEDFGVSNAQRLLDIYRDMHSVFNDDV